MDDALTAHVAATLGAVGAVLLLVGRTRLAAPRRLRRCSASPRRGLGALTRRRDPLDDGLGAATVGAGARGLGRARRAHRRPRPLARARAAARPRRRAVPPAARRRPRPPLPARGRGERRARPAAAALRRLRRPPCSPRPGAAAQRRAAAGSRVWLAWPAAAFLALCVALAALDARARRGHEHARVLPLPFAALARRRRAARRSRPGCRGRSPESRSGSAASSPRRPLAGGDRAAALLRAEARGREHVRLVLPRHVAVPRSEPLRPPSRRWRSRSCSSRSGCGAQVGSPRAPDRAAVGRALLLVLAVEHGRARSRSRSASPPWPATGSAKLRGGHDRSLPRRGRCGAFLRRRAPGRVGAARDERPLAARRGHARGRPRPPARRRRARRPAGGEPRALRAGGPRARTSSRTRRR